MHKRAKLWRYLPYLLVVILTAILGTTCYAYFVVRTTTKIDEDGTSLLQYLEEYENVDNIQILQAKQYLSHYAVAYSTNDSKIHLMVLDEVQYPFGITRYRYSGKASSSSDLSTYNYNMEGETSIIIVYGNPLPIYASYSIQNEQIICSANITDDYILDIYVVVNSANPGTQNTLYDQAGNILGHF